MLNYKKTITSVLIALVLVSCSETSYATPSIEAIETATVATNTPLPYTATPEARPAIMPASYDLPSWLTSPDSIVLAALITDDLKGIRNVAFFYAQTGERFEIPMPLDTRGFFWYDHMNFGFLSSDLKTAYRIDFATGKVYTEVVSPQSTRLLDRDWVNGLVRSQESNAEFVFDKPRFSLASKNKSFTAEWIDSQKNIVVTDTRTKQIVWQTNTAENYWTTSFLWSPVKDTHLAFLQGSFRPNTDMITENISLSIVDVITGKIVSTFAGDFGGLEWSSNGKMILYQDALVHYNNYGVPFQGAPCILFLESGEKRCLRAIPRLVPAGYKLKTTQNYSWDIDSDAIFYTYVYASQTEEKMLGSLCIYSLVDGHITCPTQNLDVMHDSGVGLYEMSPNQEFVHFCYWNQNEDTAYDGIIRFNGNDFLSWIGAIQDKGPTVCSFDTLWRPLP